MFEASYLKLYRNGELKKRVRESAANMKSCELCPIGCRVNRLDHPEHAFCRTGKQAIVSSAGPHFGEERPISGRQGSGTIFFGYCNLRCLFCQNWEISHQGEGLALGAESLAKRMLSLQALGCHNINFVSPSHVIPHILSALLIACDHGFKLPLVYNTGGYDNVLGLQYMDGIIDIYMPDMKFFDSSIARRYVGVADYAEINRRAVLEMHRQVGPLVLDATGVAQRGLLIRHLILPEFLAGTKDVLKFIAERISCDTYVNLMDQYRPCYQAHNHPELNRRPSRREIQTARGFAKELGLNRLD